VNLFYRERFAVIDIESTGVHPTYDAIVQLAVVQVDCGLIKLRASWYINPERPVGPAAAIHGITDDQLQSAAPFRDVAADIFAAIGDRIVVGYNVAKFDVPILRNHLARVGLTWEPRQVLDAWHIVSADAGSKRLSAAASHYGVAVNKAHDALDDVRTCWNVLTRAASHLVGMLSEDELGMPSSEQMMLITTIESALARRAFAEVRSLVAVVADREPKLAQRALAAIQQRQLHEGFFTVVHEDESYTTVRIRRQKADADFAPGQLVLSYLSGSDNERDYTQFALESHTGPIVVFKKFKQNTRLADVVRVLTKDPKASALAYAMRSGRCSRCGRTLTVPASLHSGMGPDCAEKGL
jgi:DNA polymerase III epsilon subunit family exonuclease